MRREGRETPPLPYTSMRFVLPTSGRNLPCAVPKFTGIRAVTAQPAYPVYTNCKNWGGVRTKLQGALNVYTEWGQKYNLLLNASKSKAMLICNSLTRRLIECPAPFNAGNRQIVMCVHNYYYLGCVINDELTILNEYKAVYRKAEWKV